MAITGKSPASPEGRRPFGALSARSPMVLARRLRSCGYEVDKVQETTRQGWFVARCTRAGQDVGKRFIRWDEDRGFTITTELP